MALAERMFDRPGEIIRQPVGAQFLIDRISGWLDFVAGQPVADFGCALMDVVDGAVQIFGRLSAP